MTTYYLKSAFYVGPEDQMASRVSIHIDTHPARTEWSDFEDECIEGWCGRDHLWSITAYGAYKTEFSARSAAQEIFGELVEEDYPHDPETFRFKIKGH